MRERERERDMRKLKRERERRKLERERERTREPNEMNRGMEMGRILDEMEFKLYSFWIWNCIFWLVGPISAIVRDQGGETLYNYSITWLLFNQQNQPLSASIP